jgi:hypothetical protein
VLQSANPPGISLLLKNVPPVDGVSPELSSIAEIIRRKISAESINIFSNNLSIAVDACLNTRASLGFASIWN